MSFFFFGKGERFPGKDLNSHLDLFFVRELSEFSRKSLCISEIVYFALLFLLENSPNILPKKNYVMDVSMDDNLVAKAGFLDSPFGQELKCHAAVYWQTWPSHSSIFRSAAFAWLAFANFESDQWDFLLIESPK